MDSAPVVRSANTDPPPAAGPRSAAWWFPAIAACCGAASIVLAMRPFFLSGGDAVSGGAGDTRLQVVILEHWLAVFTGRAPFTSPSFYHPVRHVLGYSDTLFLYVPPYALARLLGLDRYLAFEVTLITLKAIGFAAMVVWLRRVLGVARPLAVLGGVLFVVSHAYYVSVGHGQLASIAFLPVFGLLAHAYWRHRRAGRTAHARVAMVAAGLLLGLLLFTAFYIGWFAIFVGGILAMISLPRVVAAIRLVGPRAVLIDAVVGTLALVVALVPFAIVYLPVLRRIGGRSFYEVGLYTAYPWDVVNLGSENLVWSAILARILPGNDDRFIFAYYEAQRGWPPLLLVLFLAATAAAVWQLFGAGTASTERRRARLIATLGAASVVAWGSSIQVAGMTPWALVYRVVPGASAIRVPVRINLAINVLVIAGAMLGLDRFLARIPSQRRRVASAGMAMLAVALVAEQVNTANPFHLSRAQEREVLRRIQSIPAACRAFYVVRPPTSDPMETIDTQTLAMLVSIDTGVPTINGYSGNFPAGYRLANLDADYPKHVMQWIRGHRLARGMCILDLERGVWSEAPPPPRRPLGGAT